MTQTQLPRKKPAAGTPARKARGKTPTVFHLTQSGAISLFVDDLAPRPGWIVPQRCTPRVTPGAGSDMSEGGR